MHDKRKPQLHYAAQLQREHRRRQIKKNIVEGILVLVTAAVWLGIAYVGVTLMVGG